MRVAPAKTRPLHTAEAADRIALHLSRQIEQSLAAVGDGDRVQVGIEVARDLIARLAELVDTDTSATPVEPGEVLHAILERRPDGTPQPIAEPLIPLLDTTLLTNAPGEPVLLNQLDAEIDSADAIDVVMAFIRRSGINPLLASLRRHCERGRPLRVLTTTYTGSTERAALDQLTRLGADVRISYDLSTTRLHAKAWIFHRRSGFSTAYVGSSNLTHSAQVTGLEWNIRASSARNPDILAKFEAVFESYWQSADFVPYDPDQFDEETERAGRTDTGPVVVLSPIELRLEPFQERLLEQISLSRGRGHHRNLLVAATGTGKTVMAAVDYARLREDLPRSRLLFVAHRNEILDQSLATFRYALRDASFGEKWIGGSRPQRFEHVFASIQSLNAANLDDLAPDHFDVVIVDEFHHAAAPSYRKLLDHVQPRELLGLTATPERSDDLSILHWFDDRIAAELRLWDAIDQQRLSPFMYFGIHDGLDLTDIPWRRGQGYDIEALSNLYTSTDAWARTVLQEVLRLADDPSTMRALGFCVSIDHARFMANHFNKPAFPPSRCGVTARRPTARRHCKTSPPARSASSSQSTSSTKASTCPRSTPCSCCVRPRAPRCSSNNLDVACVDRRTRRSAPSSTSWARIARSSASTAATALSSAARDATSNGPCSKAFRSFPPAVTCSSTRRPPRSCCAACARRFQPAGRPASKNCGSSTPSTPTSRCRSTSRSPGSTCPTCTTAHVAGRTCARRLVCRSSRPGEHEKPLRKALGRLLHIDDDERIATYRRLLESSTPVDVSEISERERRLVRMLVASLGDQVLKKDHSLQDAVDLVWSHPQVRAELAQLLVELDERIDHLHGQLDRHPDVPLQVHARYSRIEILAAIGIGTNAKVAAWQSGVYEAKDANAELFAFTLDKSSGAFSPTTRYRDYAISPTLIHWESQSMTREDSDTGLRYRNHERDGRSIMLFTRLRADDRAFWFLGPATYRGHVGEKPMAITWELHTPLPGDLYQSFAAAVA